MSWNFYLDESGHDGKNTPSVVVAGFGIEAAKETLFLKAITELYKECFGIVYDGHHELKGSSLFEKKKIRWANEMPQFSDADRQTLSSEFLNNSGNAGFRRKTSSAYGQACIFFTSQLIKIINSFECFILSDKRPYGLPITIIDPEIIKLRGSTLHKNDENYTAYLLNELERGAYSIIIDLLINEKISNFGIYLDKSETKSDQLRLEFLMNRLHYFNHQKKHNIIFQLNVVDSKDNLFIQIADIICYMINWNLNTDQLKLNNHNYYKKALFRPNYT